MSGRFVHGETRLAGRQEELRPLLSALEEAASGSARMILVRGAAGSGKTALMDALERHARHAGATVLRGSCSPAGALKPWHAAESLFGQAPPPGERAAAPLSHRLLRRVAEAASSGPVAIMLDDTQWCDEESLAWLDFLMNRGHRLPLLVVLARRRSGQAAQAGQDDQDGWHRAVPGVAARGHRTVTLGPLPEEHAAELARRWWDAVPDKPFVRACTSVCRGNPALLARLFARLSEEGVPADARGVLRAREVGAGLFAWHLLATLDGGPEHVRKVVEALAVLGQADAELVGMLCGVSQPLVADAIELLRDEAIIDADLAELTDDRVRAGVLSAMPPGVLDRWRRLAAQLLNDAGRPVEEIGAQLVLLPTLPEPWMRDVLRAAARSAERDGAARTAARYLGRMVVDDPGDLDAQADLARLIGHGDPAQVISEREMAMGMPQADAAGERKLLAVRSMISAMSGGSAQSCAALAREALDGADDGWALGPAACVLSLADETREAVAALDRMIARATEHGDDWARVMALSTRSLILGEAGELDRALMDATRAVKLADESSWSKGVTAPRTALAAALARRGDVERAALVLDQITSPDLEESLSDYPRVLMTRSHLAVSRGDLEGALSSLTACGALLAEAGVRNANFVPWWLEAACVLAELGRAKEAEEYVEHGERLAAAWGTASARGFALLARGVITEGREGVEILTRSVETLAGTPARWYLVRAQSLLGEALLRMDDREGARGHFRQAVYLSVRCGFRTPAAKARDRLVAAGGWMYQGDGGVRDVLTSAERRVAELAAAGATNREIAHTLRIAVRTVEIHLTSIFRKLGVSGRADLGGGWTRPARRGVNGGTGVTGVTRQGRVASPAGAVPSQRSARHRIR
ncbi:BREX system ATP-binding domain-containing protein [Nonomuraea sp. NPDC050404]|uniref:AAA family ATPase n=1 Tax=Nonomuraea sp. NPDC050404 TaxID=3155783 RepID=UPI0033C5F3B1